jgi:hypothetical protein
MMPLIHSLETLQRCRISSLRSHRSNLPQTTLYRSVAAVSLGGAGGLPVVWCWSPWAWQAAAPEASDARDWVGPHSSRSRRVSHWAMVGWRGPGVVGGFRSGRDRLGRAAGGGARRKTCWRVNSRLARWRWAASTVVSHRSRLRSLEDAAVALWCDVWYGGCPRAERWCSE